MKKICIVSTSLGKGGAERSAAILSQMLYKLKYDVHVLVTKNLLEYDYEGTLFNLEQVLADKKSNYLKAIILKKYFKEKNFDYIIDNRIRDGFFKELVLYKYIFKGSKIISVVRSFYLENYIPKNKILAKVLYGGIYKTVAVSEKIKDQLNSFYKLNNVIRIYNAIDTSYLGNQINKDVNLSGRFILFYGRIEDDVKNLKLLIHAYKESRLLKNEIKLVILGVGSDLHMVKKMARDLGLQKHMVFMSFEANPFTYVHNALFTVLTSRYEGFPRSIIESLACGTPVISVDCNSGPGEIVLNRSNGLLVENHNINALAKAFNELVENQELYKYCKQNAKKSIKHLAVDKIGLQWKAIIDGNI